LGLLVIFLSLRPAVFTFHIKFQYINLKAGVESVAENSRPLQLKQQPKLASLILFNKLSQASAENKLTIIS
jgi:hypothetical protein